MADNPQVLAPTPEPTDEADGLYQDVEEWFQGVKEQLKDILKNVKCETALALLRAVERLHGKEAPGAFTNLKLKGGPNKDDRVVIIGGGPAGLHMAYLLKTVYKCTNVVVLEKEERVGGKSCSVEHRVGDRMAVQQEMGSCYMSPDYVEVRKLMNEVKRLLPEEEQKTWREEKVIGRTIFNPDADERDTGVQFEEWLHKEIRQACGIPEESFFHRPTSYQLLKDSYSYIKLHHNYFGKYKEDGFLMAEPKHDLLSNPEELNCTIEELLRREKLFALIPIFKLAFTLQGYGFLEDAPAIYGLMWVTPALIIGLVEQLKVRRHWGLKHSQPDEEEDVSRSITVLRHGFQTVWIKLIECAELSVRRNCRITAIRRNLDGGVQVEYTTGGRTADDDFDFLVIAAPIQDLLPSTPGGDGVLDVRSSEQEIFSSLRRSTFITTLFEYTPPPEDNDNAVHSWFDNVRKDRPLSVWSLRDNYKLLRQNHTGQDSFLAQLPEPKTRSSAVAYQYSDEDVGSAKDNEIERVFQAHFAKHHLRDINVVKRCKWPYFPRYSLEAINEKAAPWKLLEIQGQNRTWYVGTVTCFEALNAIISYNERLVQTWKKQTESASP